MDGLLIGSGITNGDVMFGAEDRDVVGMGDVWIAAAGVDDGFHLGSATSGGIRFPLSGTLAGPLQPASGAGVIGESSGAPPALLPFLLSPPKASATA